MAPEETSTTWLPAPAAGEGVHQRVDPAASSPPAAVVSERGPDLDHDRRAAATGHGRSSRPVPGGRRAAPAGCSPTPAGLVGRSRPQVVVGRVAASRSSCSARRARSASASSVHRPGGRPASRRAGRGPDRRQPPSVPRGPCQRSPRRRRRSAPSRRPRRRSRRPVTPRHRRRRPPCERVLDTEPGQPVGEVADRLVVGELGLARPSAPACRRGPEAASPSRSSLDGERRSRPRPCGRSTIRVGSGGQAVGPLGGDELGHRVPERPQPLARSTALTGSTGSPRASSSGRHQLRELPAVGHVDLVQRHQPRPVAEAGPCAS